MAKDPTQLVDEQSPDAMEWAESFVETVKGRLHDRGAHLDPGFMVGWFANAIEAARGHDQTKRRQDLAVMTDQEARAAAEYEWADAQSLEQRIHGGSVTISGHYTPADPPSDDPGPYQQIRKAMDYISDTFGSPERVLGQWWRDKAKSEIDKTVAKAVEYGAGDLVEIGRQLVQAGVRLGPATPDDADAYFAELGCFFYACGKMARWTSAISEGRQVSDDTLFDIGVYIRMVQRIREAGSWPGV